MASRFTFQPREFGGSHLYSIFLNAFPKCFFMGPRPWSVCVQLLQMHFQNSAGLLLQALPGAINREGKGAGPKQRRALSSCASKYKAVLIADVPQATEALQKGDPKFAEDGANDAANEATFCESDFSGN
ncbi:hypothetical protein VIGAN_03285000 [Vigna angularis var. angularis]|uniref:Pectinesterase inhibitor domain-containing protein n=1 Tax=Vigna angularis var. angularis TaxID=157739 RepID=A0A0S3RQD5_PHAAN|nr:hypothetical protein VIGAN_03285000 [Vigna angularis var. angularis]